MKPKIVVVGSSNTDMIIKVPHLPLPGETILGDDFRIVHGGKGANQAVAIANKAAALSVTRWGASTSIPYIQEVF